MVDSSLNRGWFLWTMWPQQQQQQETLWYNLWQWELWENLQPVLNVSLNVRGAAPSNYSKWKQTVVLRPGVGLASTTWEPGQTVSPPPPPLLSSSKASISLKIRVNRGAQKWRPPKFKATSFITAANLHRCDPVPMILYHRPQPQTFTAQTVSGLDFGEFFSCQSASNFFLKHNFFCCWFLFNCFSFISVLSNSVVFLDSTFRLFNIYTIQPPFL